MNNKSIFAAFAFLSFVNSISCSSHVVAPSDKLPKGGESILPVPNQVSKIIVHCPAGENKKQIKLELPVELSAEVLGFFQPPVQTEAVAGAQHLAELRIYHSNNKVSLIDVVFAGKEPLRFRVNDIEFLRGGKYQDVSDGENIRLPESLTLEFLFRVIHQELNSNERYSSVVDGLINKLRRSAGRQNRSADKQWEKE